MTDTTLGSFSALVLVALVALLLVHALRRSVASPAAAWLLVVLLVVAAGAGIYFVDTNVPLVQSHFRPGGEAAPAWAALLAWGSRFAALFALVHLAPWSASRGTHA